jgi:Deoxynucleotide monophosphate kinase
MNCDCIAISELLSNCTTQCTTQCEVSPAITTADCASTIMLPFVIIYCIFLFLIFKYAPFPDKDPDDPSEIDEIDESDNIDTEFDISDLVVFGMSGRKRSGKDTSGERLVNEHGFVRIAFADSLKEACIAIFGFSREQVYGDDFKEVIDEYWEYSPREVLQKVGTELFREVIPQDNVLPKIGKDIWVRTVERKILNLAKQGHRRFVITDVRFPNELAFLKDSEFNAFSIKVIRQSVMTETDPSQLHASEALIDGFNCDFEIENSGTVEDLFTGIDQIVSMTEESSSPELEESQSDENEFTEATED